jgi:hypothetical protein
MKRTEYLETREGQAHERLKRSLSKVYLRIDQEPKSKNSISLTEKREFRKQVKDYLRQTKRRPFRGDIILEIDFQTTKNNPPALQTLTKNYLDLLHKPMPEVDNLQGILFDDDNQIKTLIANYHVDPHGDKKAGIRIRVYRYSHFIKDIELAERILINDFEDRSSRDYDFEDASEFDEDRRGRLSDDHYDDLSELERDKDWFDQKFGPTYYQVQKHYLQRRIQEQYLKRNNASLSDLLSLFRVFFKRTKKYEFDKDFIRIDDLISRLISVSTNLMELGGAPVREGDTKIFKENLQQKLTAFKSKYKILFPLLQPISVTVLYTPPKGNVIDLDNLARNIIPLLADIFEPPTSLHLTYDTKFLNELLKIETQIVQKFPKNGISNYQLIHRPRTKDSLQEGIINFYITDGVFSDNNVWKTIDKFIDSWTKR